MLTKKIYIIQPTYRRMDGSKVKGWSLFNHSLFLPVFNAVIPADWERESCLGPGFLQSVEVQNFKSL